MGRLLAIVMMVLFFSGQGMCSGWQTLLDPATESNNTLQQDGEEQPAGDEQRAVSGLMGAIRSAADFYNSKRSEGFSIDGAAQATVEHLKGLEGIAGAGISEDECTIWITDVSGTTGTFIFKPMGEAEGPGGEEQVQAAVWVRDDFLSLTEEPSQGGRARRAIIIEPFESTDGKSGDLHDQGPEKIDTRLAKGGYDVTHLRGGEATVEQFSGLGQYDVIYIHTHCGYNRGNGNWMTGEPVTEEKTREYEQRYGKGVSIGRTSGGQETYSINAEFVRKIRKFNKSVVYVSGCNSNRGKEQNTMAKALKENGAEAFIGYNGFMLKGYATKNTDVDFFRYLVLYGLTIEEAMAKKPNGHYGFAYPLKTAGKLATSGNSGAIIDVDNAKRIDLLKNEHRRLQGELEILRNKIHGDPSGSKVKEWESQMDAIRKEQKEIYALVLRLRQAAG